MRSACSERRRRLALRGALRWNWLVTLLYATCKRRRTKIPWSKTVDWKSDLPHLRKEARRAATATTATLCSTPRERPSTFIATVSSSRCRRTFARGCMKRSGVAHSVSDSIFLPPKLKNLSEHKVLSIRLHLEADCVSNGAPLGRGFNP